MRGQTALEFIILTGFMLFVFTSFFFVLQQRSAIANRQVGEGELHAVADVLQQEIAIASQVHDGYNRTFELPATVNGDNYAVTVQGNSEVSIKTLDNEYLLFLPVNVSIDSGSGPQSSGVLQAGKNTIVRSNGNITIFPH